MAARDNASAAPEAPTMEVTRVFDAPRRLVFEAWTRPEHLVRWWGPKGFTLPTCEVDFRVGGAYRMVMRAPDGTDHGFGGVYTEIVPPERIVFTALIDGSPERELVTTATFEERDGKTTLTVRQTAPASPDHARGQRQGWTEQLARLADFLVQR